MKKLISISVLMLAVSLMASGCNGKGAKQESTAQPTTEVKSDDGERADLDLLKLTENTIDAVITFTNGETIDIELYPDVAPKTVANFINYVNSGFYEGTIIHRVVDGFVIQGGGYDAELNRKTVSETVEGEFKENGIENPLHHDRGVISMARIPSEANSASTQFFIVVEDNRDALDGQYAAFGKVKGGMDVVDEIASTEKMQDPPAGLNDMPDEIYEIESVNIINKDAAIADEASDDKDIESDKAEEDEKNED